MKQACLKQKHHPTAKHHHYIGIFTEITLFFFSLLAQSTAVSVGGPAEALALPRHRLSPESAAHGVYQIGINSFHQSPF